MTVLNNIFKITSAADGAILEFPFSFKIYNDTEIVVTELDEEDVEVLPAPILNVDYTVDIDPVNPGGIITFLVAPEDGHSIKRQRSIPFAQTTVIPDVGQARKEQLEVEFDRGVMRDIELLDRIEAIESGELSLGPEGPQGDPGEDGADGDRYATTSTTSLLLSSSAQHTLLIELGLSYTPAQEVIIANDATHYQIGNVDSYNPATGILIATMTSKVGAGTFASWQVNVSGAPGPQGPTGPAGAAGPQGDPGDAASTGSIIPWPMGVPVPSGWLKTDEAAYARATYPTLFALLNPTFTFTVTIASPAVFTAVAHGRVAGDKIRLTTAGTLPTGLAISTDYFIIAAGLTADAFQVSTLRGGSAVNTSGSQSGVHTAQLANSGLGNGTTTFNVPKYPQKTLLGQDQGARLLNVRVYTASATWTRPDGCTAVEVEVQAGGGYGGQPDGSSTPGSGGGGGGYTRKWIAVGLGATETVTVGGLAGASSFGSHASATPGANGSNSSPGGAGGEGTGGDINITGQTGRTGALATSNPTTPWSNGGGGNSVLGFGGDGGWRNGLAGQANGYGGGGGGQNAGLASGSPGVVIVREYIAPTDVFIIKT